MPPFTMNWYDIVISNEHRRHNPTQKIAEGKSPLSVRLALSLPIFLIGNLILPITTCGRTSYTIRITSRCRGPCTPLIRVISISAVAEGPEKKVVVNSAVPLSLSIACGTVSTTSATFTTQR